MDSDSFYPAIIRAAQVIGLGEVVLKKVQALGIRLNEEEPKPPFPYTSNLNKIEWFNKAQNKVKQLIVGLSFGNTHFLEMIASGNWGNSLFYLQSTDVEPEGGAAEAGLGVVDRITKAVKFKTLLDSEQRSHFVQVPSAVPKNLCVTVGEGLMFFNASTLSNTTEFAHGLGKTPIAVLFTAYLAPSPEAIPVFNILAMNAVSVAFNASVRPPAIGPGNVNFKWIAIG